MQIADGIKDLIRLDDSVALPGLGFFKLKKESAQVSLGDGSFQAPKTHLEFVNDRFSKDKRLSTYLAKQKGISPEEGQAEVEVFMDKLRMIAANNDELVIENLGRFYGKNERLYFDAAVYNERVKKALPSFTAAPIERSRQEKKNIQTITPKREFSRTRQSSPGINWAQLLSGLLLFLFLGWIGKWIYDGYNSDRDPIVTNENPIVDPKNDSETEKQLTDHQENITDDNQTEDTNFDPDENSADETEEPKLDDNKEEESESNKQIVDQEPALVNSIMIDGEELTPRIVNGENCAIILGVYGQKSNADRQLDIFAEKGYTPYSMKNGSLHRVGVQIRCDENNIREKLAEVKEKFKQPNAWLME